VCVCVGEGKGRGGGVGDGIRLVMGATFVVDIMLVLFARDSIVQGRPCIGVVSYTGTARTQ